MKKTIFNLLLIFVAATMNAQTIVKGDMNDDNELTITDAVSVVNVILGNAPKQTISLMGNPYLVDNILVVGTWYAPDGTSFTLNEDGTTSYPGATTYKFRPNLGTLLFFNASGRPVKKIVLDEVEKGSYLLSVNSSTNTYTYYTNSGSLVTNLAMSESTLSMNSGSTHQLMVVATPENAFNTNVTWESSDENVATVDQSGLVTAIAGGTCIISATATDGSGQLSTCELTVIQMVTNITLSQTIVALRLDEFVRLTATVLPTNAANKNVVWSSSNEDVASVRNGRVDAYDYGEAIITCTAADGSGVFATCKINVINDEYVDLGLPSGTLWARCNVGAYSPEEYGDYFRWGETVKIDHNIPYKWRDERGDFTKYNCVEGKGVVDNLTVLEPEDDVAYVNWGSDWRMPSVSQLSELINNTTIEWTSSNGVYGLVVTSNINGNSIFLPAAGSSYLSSGVISELGTSCFYVGNSISSTEPAAAIYIGNKANTNEMRFSYLYATRIWGNSVRPVRNQ